VTQAVPTGNVPMMNMPKVQKSMSVAPPAMFEGLCSDLSLRRTLPSNVADCWTMNGGARVKQRLGEARARAQSTASNQKAEASRLIASHPASRFSRPAYRDACHRYPPRPLIDPCCALLLEGRLGSAHHLHLQLPAIRPFQLRELQLLVRFQVALQRAPALRDGSEQHEQPDDAYKTVGRLPPNEGRGQLPPMRP
jgi:hypothetical protein